MFDRGKRSKRPSYVKPVKNISKKYAEFSTDESHAKENPSFT